MITLHFIFLIICMTIHVAIVFWLFQTAKEKRKYARIIFICDFKKIAEFPLGLKKEALKFADENPECTFMVVEDTEIIFYEQPAHNLTDFYKTFVK